MFNIAFLIELIGSMAAVCTTAAFFPQAVKVYKTRETSSISLSMFVIFNIGVVLWAIYGVCIKNTPIILANIVTMIFAFYILVMKLTEKNRNKEC